MKGEKVFCKKPARNIVSASSDSAALERYWTQRQMLLSCLVFLFARVAQPLRPAANLWNARNGC